ncbi:MAG: hypothetical protein KBC33_01610 [Candidatus Pacebacteria bacterium]|nr:hypothetical protein [Candidatus Paceibacterota bacterium]
MKHHHSHTALFIIACSTVLVVFGVYGYMRHRITASLERVIQGRHLVAEHTISEQKQDALAELYSASTEDRHAAKKLFVPEDSTIAFIESIESIGPSSGSTVELSAIEADAPGESSGVGRIRVHVEAVGSWSTVMRAVMLAENLSYGVSVSNLRIDASGGSSAKDRLGWKASFVIEALMTPSIVETQP